MADIKIVDLNLGTVLGANDAVVLVQGSETLKIIGQDVADGVKILANLADKSYVDSVAAGGSGEVLEQVNASLAEINTNLATKLPTANFGFEFWNALANVSTYHIAENSNLYFTEQRVLDVVMPLIPTSIFDLGVPDVGTPENILGYLYYNGNSLSWQAVDGFSGDYNDLINKPTIPAPYSLPTASTSVLGGVKVDGNTIVIDSYGTITAVAGGVMSPNPVFNSVTATQLNVQNVAFTGTGAVNIASGNDLNLSAAGNITFNGSQLAEVAFSGDYNDLINKPSGGGGSVSWADIIGKPSFATVATSGSYVDLVNKPASPTYDTVIILEAVLLPNHAATKSYVDSQLNNVPAPSWNAITNVSNDQGPTRIALGRNAGGSSDADGYGGYGGYGAYGGGSSPFAIAIGNSAGRTNQGGAAIGIGVATGYTDQGAGAIAIGLTAGNVYQGLSAIAIGESAGNSNQGDNGVAIGNTAGYTNQGANAIAIGKNAGKTNQPAGSIVINASGNELNGSALGFYVNPIRSATATDYVAYYDPTTKEVTYGPAPTGGVMSPDPVFDSVTATDLNVQNVTFTGTGAVTITSGNDLNLVAAGNVLLNGQKLFTPVETNVNFTQVGVQMMTIDSVPVNAGKVVEFKAYMAGSDSIQYPSIQTDSEINYFEIKVIHDGTNVIVVSSISGDTGSNRFPNKDVVIDSGLIKFRVQSNTTYNSAKILRTVF